MKSIRCKLSIHDWSEWGTVAHYTMWGDRLSDSMLFCSRCGEPMLPGVGVREYD